MKLLTTTFFTLVLIGSAGGSYGQDANNAESIVDGLSRLAEMHEQGLLTEAEFTAAKGKLLGAFNNSAAMTTTDPAIEDTIKISDDLSAVNVAEESSATPDLEFLERAISQQADTQNVSTDSPESSTNIADGTALPPEMEVPENDETTLGTSESSERVALSIPTSSFFERPPFNEVKISPDGMHLAVSIMDSDEESRLLIINLETREPVSSFNTQPNQIVGDFYWVNEERIIFSTMVFQGGMDIPFYTGELYAFNIDNTSKFRLLDRIDDSGAFYISHLIPDDPEHIRVTRKQVRRSSTARSKPNSFLLDVYATPTGNQNNKLTDRVIGPLPWGELYSDNTGNTRVAAATNENGTITISYQGDTDWVDISGKLQVNSRPLIDFTFVGFNSTNEEFYYLGVGENGIRGLYLYSHDYSSSDLIYQQPNMDIAFQDLIFASDNITILGVELSGDEFEHHYFLEHPESDLHESLDASFPGERVSITSISDDGRLAVILVDGPKRWGDFFIFDRDRVRLDEIFSRSEILTPELMANVSPFAIRAADDLAVHGYVTSPQAASGPVPMIVIPHGGPIGVRDRPFFNAEAQFFAHHGFAVLHVNYRGSGGYGRPFEKAGNREWGTGIIDDITLATKWAIQEDITEQGQICIYGGSFGAYAALTSVTREPDLYQCAIGYAGVYDLTKMDRSDIPWQPGGDNYLEETLGSDEDELKAQSPVYNAGKIDVPIMIAHGGEDRRAPAFHARDMRDALEKEGKEIEWFYKRGEGHGFYSAENRVDFYNKALEFLAENLNKENSL